MSDYIKREDAINAVANNYWNGTECECYAFAHKALDGIQSADVAPVKHGRWEEKDIIEDRKGLGIISDWQSARCSVCGKYHTTPYAYYFTNYEYCPSCGAKMDAEREEDG